MDERILHIRMLGGFSLSKDDRQIDDGENRSRKVWLLLAYMIYNRRNVIPQDELIGLLWGEEERSSNPLNALKTVFHRVRSMLNQLEPSVGHTMIVRKGGNYAWNTNLPIELDVERFSELCQAGDAARDEDGRLDHRLQALALYQGDFLEKLSAEPWVVPIAAYYHNVYVRTVLEVLPLLRERNRLEESTALARAALKVEPYNEILYQHLMRDLVALGEHKTAAAVYDEMSELLFSNFGIMPSDETRVLYRSAVQTINERAVSLSVLREQLQEQHDEPGALICDYDFFKLLYQAEARAVSRNGNAVHIALLSVRSGLDKELSKRSLDRAIENLRDQIRTNLRRGDVAARCSVSQYILLLPQANYENSCLACRRIIKSFSRQYPHSHAQLHYSVQPLEPAI